MVCAFGGIALSFWGPFASMHIWKITLASIVWPYSFLNYPYLLASGTTEACILLCASYEVK